MADGLSPLKARLTTAVEVTVGSVRRHAFWIALPVAVLGVVLVAWLVGAGAQLRADEWRVRSGELLATREAAAMWREELIPPTDRERARWQESEAAVQERAIDPADRLALLQEVAQRAEDLGIAGVSVFFESADTLETSAIREVGEAVFEVAPWAMGVRFVAGYEAVSSFIGSLPPQVDVHRMRLSATEAGVETELLLIMFANDGS